MLRRVAVLRCGGRSALRQRALASKSHAHGRSVEPVGSEQHQTLDAATKTALASLTGTPVEHLSRSAVIYRPAKCTMQSGKDLKKKWKLAFPGAETWRNPLMGWTSSGDPLSSMEMMFTSKEDAVRFCEKNGYNYTIDGERDNETNSKTYADNFKYRPPAAKGAADVDFD